MKKLAKRLASVKGQGLVEYALIIALVAIVLTGALGTLQATIAGVFTGISGALGGL